MNYIGVMAEPNGANQASGSCRVYSLTLAQAWLPNDLIIAPGTDLIDLRANDVPAEFLRPQFGHSDVVALTGLNVEQLMNWFKRGIIEEQHGREKKKGVRRKYALAEIAFLRMLRELTRCGVGLLNAKATAGAIVANHFFEIWADAVQGRATQETDSVSIKTRWLLFSMSDADLGAELLGKATRNVSQLKELLGKDFGACRIGPMPTGGVERWMEAEGAKSASVLDLTSIALDLLMRSSSLREGAQ